MARPGVVWFGEALPAGVWSAAEKASNCELFLVIGTSAIVYPAAGLVHLAQSCGAKVIEINTEPTAISNAVDCSLVGPAGGMLPRLLTSACN